MGGAHKESDGARVQEIVTDSSYYGTPRAAGG